MILVDTSVWRLLGSARLARAVLWTRDKRLLAAAADLGVDVYDEST